MDILDKIGDFTHIGFELFFVETNVGNFLYDRLHNTMSKYEGSYYAYLNNNSITKTKYRGRHNIREYCGDNIKILE